MDESTFKHLSRWAIDYRLKPFETISAITTFLSRLDRETAKYLLENRSWSEIEELTFR